MKHCPNRECPDRVSATVETEYRDDVETCPVCGTPLRDGPAPRREDEESADDAGPVTVATFPTPHEAHLARCALESHAMRAIVLGDHGQYYTAAAWVRLHVARRDLDFAIAVLDRGPQVEDRDTGAGTSADIPAAGPVDDLRPLRLQRRFALARWFLWTGAVAAFPWTLIMMPVFVVPAGLAVWSRYQPGRAFGVAFGLQIPMVFLALATSGLAGLVAVIPLLAFHQARVGSRPEPPEELLETPFPATPVVDIGDAWDVPPAEPPERPARLARALAIAAGVAVAVWAGWLALPSLQRALAGSTEVTFEAEAGSALLQELRSGQARLAHELHQENLQFETIERSRPDGLEVTGIDPAAGERAEAVVESLFPGWKAERTSPSGLRVVIPADARERIVAAALQDVQARLRRDFGATPIGVERRGGGALELRMRFPGDWAPERIRATFAEPLMLEFREVVYPEAPGDPEFWMPAGSPEGTAALFGGRLPPGTELVAEPTSQGFTLYWPLRETPLIVGPDLVEVRPDINQWGEPALAFRLSPEAGRRLEAATRRLVGRRMAIVLSGEDGAGIVSAPLIMDVIAAEGIIQGPFTEQDVEALVLKLRGGSRALRLTPAIPRNGG